MVDKFDSKLKKLDDKLKTQTFEYSTLSQSNDKLNKDLQDKYLKEEKLKDKLRMRENQLIEKEMLIDKYKDELKDKMITLNRF